MAKTKNAVKKKNQTTQLDGVYILKMVLYLLLGTQWLWFLTKTGSRIPLPLGLLIGVAFTTHERFQIDRKIEYAVLLVATLVGFVGGIGIMVTL